MVIANRYPLLFFLELLDPTSLVAPEVISWLLGLLLSIIPSSTKLWSPSGRDSSEREEVGFCSDTSKFKSAGSMSMAEHNFS
jgi:hypothetical protein